MSASCEKSTRSRFRCKLSVRLTMMMFLTILTACGKLNVPSGSDPETETETEIESDSSYSKVRFSLAGTRGAPMPAGVSRSADTPEPNEVIYIDAESDGNTVRHQPLTAGMTEIDLRKDAIHLVSFVHNPSLARNAGTGTRSASSAIQTIGNLKIVASGLDSIPLGQNAANVVDLGDLTVANGSVNSMISTAMAQSSLGYDDLDSYSMFDNSFSKMLNPDINRNGTYDTEEGMKWVVSGTSVNFLFTDDFNAEGPTFPITEFRNDPPIGLVFWLNRAFAHPDYSTVYLRLPQDQTYRNRDGVQVDGVYARWHGENGGPGGIYNQYYFGFDDLDPKPPYRGDYELVISGNAYLFRNLSFPEPGATSFDGFLFLQTEVTFDASNYLDTVTYTWWISEGGMYHRASENEVRLIASQAIIIGHQPSEFGKAYYRSDSLDFSRYRVNKENFIGINSDTGTYRCDYWDRSGNEFNFSTYLNRRRGE